MSLVKSLPNELIIHSYMLFR